MTDFRYKLRGSLYSKTSNIALVVTLIGAAVGVCAASVQGVERHVADQRSRRGFNLRRHGWIEEFDFSSGRGRRRVGDV